MSITRVLPAAVAALVLGTVSAALAQTPPPPPPPAAAPGQPQPVLLLTPVAIDKMQADNVVAVKGTVAEIFGNKFVLQDDTGRALVELGPQGEDGNVVTKGEAVTVQGRFERGFVHAQLVAHADGRNQAFGPPPPPKPPRDAERGPDRRPPPPAR
jgi:uncharacterized protein YdeI (BOF family)